MRITTVPKWDDNNQPTVQVDFSFSDTDQCVSHFSEMLNPHDTSMRPSQEVLIAIGIPVSYIDRSGYIGYYRYCPRLGHCEVHSIRPSSPSFHQFLLEEDMVEPNRHYSFDIDLNEFTMFGHAEGTESTRNGKREIRT